jgi:hypothetical protein
MPKKKSEPSTSALTPVVLIGATWVVTQLAKVVHRKSTPGLSRQEAKAKREESTFYAVALTGALALTEYFVSRLMRKETNDEPK